MVGCYDVVGVLDDIVRLIRRCVIMCNGVVKRIEVLWLKNVG